MSVQHDFVCFEHESAGCQIREITRAALNLEDPIAQTAAEVMMMRTARAFIARRLTGQLHRHQPSAFDERIDRPIDRGDAQAGHLRATGFEHLGRSQWTGRALKHLANGIALLRVAFHSPNMLRFAAMTRPSSTQTLKPWLVRWLLLSMVAIVLAHLADSLAWRTLRLPDVYEKDWGRLLRSLGYLPTWGIVALAYWLDMRGRPNAGRTAGYLIVSPTVGGIVAEAGKLLFRRLRPDAETFGYAFRPYSDHFWSNRGMGLPSSHTLVAFAGAAALAQRFPRARWVFYLLAGGCALTRVMANAHFLSDTVVAACLGIAVGQILATRVLLPEGEIDQ